jgi:hypothetical protein
MVKQLILSLDILDLVLVAVIRLKFGVPVLLLLVGIRRWGRVHVVLLSVGSSLGRRVRCPDLLLLTKLPQPVRIDF